jgi:hypothetical protein
MDSKSKIYTHRAIEFRKRLKPTRLSLSWEEKLSEAHDEISGDMLFQ